MHSFCRFNAYKLFEVEHLFYRGVAIGVDCSSCCFVFLSTILLIFAMRIGVQ